MWFLLKSDFYYRELKKNIFKKVIFSYDSYYMFEEYRFITLQVVFSNAPCILLKVC